MKTRKTSRLSIRLPEKEMEQIRLNARAMGLTVSAFMRYIANDFGILKCDYEPILQHTHEITYTRNLINRLVYTIIITGEYVPADLEFIIDKMNKLSKSEKELVEFMLANKEKKTKEIVREVRKIVREKLSK